MQKTNFTKKMESQTENSDETHINSPDPFDGRMQQWFKVAQQLFDWAATHVNDCDRKVSGVLGGSREALESVRTTQRKRTVRLLE